jgi:plastocyanin
MLTLARATAAALVVLSLAGCAGAATVAPSGAPSVNASAVSSAASSAASAVASVAPSVVASLAPARPTDTAKIANFAFDPTNAGVKVGASLTWTNTDSIAHTVTFDDGSDSSGNISNSATFKRTFDKAGTFTYHCSIHPTMRGIVTVTG